ncbi:MAG TPA: putative Ig domain-containing protein [Candidatus Acidoferrum sp.]|nr:putative Ig domain-containing protein [Candidatus Acidoferrum sp.]
MTTPTSNSQNLPPSVRTLARRALAVAGSGLLVGLLTSAATAQTVPVAHWINGSGQEADTVLNSGKAFVTSFKANNDLKVTQLSGQVNSVYLDTFGGDSPGNNPSWLTGFVGITNNATGDGIPGDINDLEMDMDDDTASLQFDFLSHLGPNDRILLADVDGDEAYQIKAYTVDASSHYTAVSLSGWVGQQYSGSTGQLPDSTWPIWNAAAGTLTSGTSGDELDEEVFVLVPNQSIDRLVITKTSGGGYSTAVQFFSLGPTITNSGTLPPGSVGTYYSQALGVVGGKGPYTWSVISGMPPAGLSLSTSGVINGMPTAAGTATFFVKVTDNNGLWVSNRYTLTITTPDSTKPTISITSPTSGQHVSNAVFTVKGTAHDNRQVQAVWCQVGGVWTQPATTNGWTNWTMQVTLSPGTNVFKACAVDAYYNWSATTQSVSMVYVVSDTLRVSATGPCTMSPNYSNAVLQIGTSYSTTVTPAKGYVLSNWVWTAAGGAWGTCPTQKCSFTMQSNMVLQANIIPNPFIAVKGSYNGLWEQATRAQAYSGFLTLTLATNGTYSGSVKQGTNSYPFTGQFDVSGAAYQVVSRPKTNAWVLGMGLHFADQQVRGWLSNAVSGGAVADFVTDRAVFDAHTNPATAYTGKYTLNLPGATLGGAVSLGDSYLTLVVDAGGNAIYSGSLADGTAMGPVSVPVSAAGNVPVYVPLYGGKGSLWSWLTFEPGVPAPGLFGTPSWIKQDKAGTCYPAGLTNIMNAVGARYTAPTNATTPAVAITNGLLVFEGGKLALSLTNLFTLTPSNKVIDVSLTNHLAISLTVSNGVFSGSVREPGQTKSNVFKGVLFQDQNCGYGYFLETNVSGRVSLLPAGSGSGEDQAAIPWIRRLDLMPGTGQVMISGIFGPDVGPGSRSVTIGGFARTIASWVKTPNYDAITCDLPLQGDGALGDVCVTVNGKPSNLVTISEYRPTLVYTYSQGGLTLVVTFQPRIRADLHVARLTPGGALQPILNPNFVSDSLSTGSYVCSGSQVVGRELEQWSGSGTLSMSGLNTLGVGGMIDENSRTIRLMPAATVAQGGLTQKVTDLETGDTQTRTIEFGVGGDTWEGSDPSYSLYVQTPLAYDAACARNVTVPAQTWDASTVAERLSSSSSMPDPAVQLQLATDCVPNPAPRTGN